MTLHGYDLEREVARTASTCVLRARQRSTGRAVAIKRVTGTHPAIGGRLRHEADLLARLHHPHVVPLLDVIEDGEGLALVMPWAEGGSVADQLAAGRTYTGAEVRALLRRLVSGLAAVHRQGVLHLDLKPANVLLTADGEPLLADFGIARWVRRLNRPEEPTGTPGFVAPEVLAGDEPDTRADVYGIGALGRALGGGCPEDPALDAALGRCLAPDPADRWPSIDALAGALGVDPVPAADLDLPTASGEDTRAFGPRPPRPAPAAPVVAAPRRRPVVMAAATAVLAVAALLVLRDGHADASARSCPHAPASPAAGEQVARAATWSGGCRASALWSPLTATARVEEAGRVTRYALGEPGDVLLLGAWTAGAEPAPGLYRPSTGECFTFARWAGAAPLPSSQPTLAVSKGRARVVHGRHGDRIVVTGGIGS